MMDSAGADPHGDSAGGLVGTPPPLCAVEGQSLSPEMVMS